LAYRENFDGDGCSVLLETKNPQSTAFFCPRALHVLSSAHQLMDTSLDFKSILAVQ
jgi:hypothetical protein